MPVTGGGTEIYLLIIYSKTGKRGGTMQRGVKVCRWWKAVAEGLSQASWFAGRSVWRERVEPFTDLLNKKKLSVPSLQRRHRLFWLKP